MPPDIIIILLLAIIVYNIQFNPNQIFAGLGLGCQRKLGTRSTIKKGNISYQCHHRQPRQHGQHSNDILHHNESHLIQIYSG